MDSSSKECDTANKKVVVVKSNDFFPLRQVNLRQKRERLEELKRNLTCNNVSFISNICNLSNLSTPQHSTYASKSKQLPPNINKIQSTPKKVYKKKVSVVEDGSEKTKLVDFAGLSTASSTNNKIVVARNTTLNISDELSEEKIMELIDRKYGAALEAQLNTFGGTSGHDSVTAAKTHLKIIDPVVELPSNVYEYKLREEQFLDQINKEQSPHDEVKEAQRHLESILILDSPEDGYTLFTREELKRLPVKIFESPGKPVVKQEIVKDEEEPQKSNTALQNLKTCAEEDKIKTDTVKAEAKVENSAMIQVSHEKKLWEYDPKEINFDILMPQTNSGNISKSDTECEKCAKAVAIANEDVVIFKEMDEFIKEINVGNKILRTNDTSADINENKQDCDHNYCLQNIKIGENSRGIEIGKRDIATEEAMKQNIVAKSSNICVDAAKFEDVVKYMIQQNDLLDQIKIEETEEISIIETRKNDILERLVRETEIHIDQSENMNTTDGIANESRVSNVEISIKSVPLEIRTVTDNDNANEEVFQTGTEYKENSCASDQIHSDFQTIPPGSEVSISLYIPSNEKTSVYKETEENNSKNDLPNEERRATDNDKINRDEILMLLEKTKAIPFDTIDNFESDNKIGKEKLTHLGNSLRERITIAKKLYGELEKATESIIPELDKNLTTEEVCRLHDNLNFIKGVIQKTSAKEERKKLKYKVISIRRKSTDHTRSNPVGNKSMTKKVYREVTLPRHMEKVSNKLLRKTLLRMNKLLGVLERNGAPVNARRSNSVSKSTKSNVKTRSRVVKNSSDTVKLDSVKSCNCKELELNKSLTIVLERAGTSKTVSFKEPHILLPFENTGETSEDTAKIARSVTLPTATIKVDSRTERQVTSAKNGKDLQKDKNGTVNEEHSLRYPLRSRKVTDKCPASDPIKEYCKVPTVESSEVNNSNVISPNKTDSRKFDCVLKNDNQPCFVLYEKEGPDEPIFEKSVPNSKNKDLVDNLAGGNESAAVIRYKLRSKTLEKSVESQRRSRRF